MPLDRWESGADAHDGGSAGGINVWHRHNYAWEVTGALGIRAPAAVRASLAHYSNDADVDRFLEVTLAG